MPWFKVDDGLHSHPKAMQAGLEAMGLWVLMGSHCGFYVGQRGHVTRAAARRVAGSSRVLDRCAKRLVDAGLWVVSGDGWDFHEWDVYQPTPEKLQEERDRKARAGQMGGLAKAKVNTPRARDEHDVNTPRARDEHDVNTPRARDEHDVNTPRARDEHDVNTPRARANDSSVENHSEPPKQLLSSCQADDSGTDVARARVSRPVPSRPVPTKGEPAGVAEGSGSRLRRAEPSRADEPFWRAAYADAVSETLGKAWAFPVQKTSGLRSALMAHCPDLARADDWIRRTVPEFVRDALEGSTRTDPYGPDAFVLWLNDRPVAQESERRLRPPLHPPEPDVDDGPVLPPTPEQRAADAAFLADLAESTTLREIRTAEHPPSFRPIRIAEPSLGDGPRGATAARGTPDLARDGSTPPAAPAGASAGRQGPRAASVAGS